jgi:hypothetical protein
MNNRPAKTDQLIVRCMQAQLDGVAQLNTIIAKEGMSHRDAVKLSEHCQAASCAARELERRAAGVEVPRVG